MEDKKDKGLTAGILGVVLVIVVIGMFQGLQPTPQYTCPICGERFFTYDEVYQHFITEHPAEPIDIIWE